MFIVSVIGEFSSAHFLKNYNGKCENLHGHNYKIQVFLKRENLNSSFMVEDFTKLKDELKKIFKSLDHKNLNEIDFFNMRNPTAEIIAFYIYQEMKKKFDNLFKVRVWETEKQYAEYLE